MSKLFDQLKDAARSREEKSPGLLADALKRQQENVAGGPATTVAPAEPVIPGAPKEPLPKPRSAAVQAPATRISQYSGVGLAIIVFAVAVLAWRSAPWSPPRKYRIDPAELKLDRTLDLQRAPSKGTSPGGPPS